MRRCSRPRRGSPSESDVVRHDNNQSQAKDSRENQSHDGFSVTPVDLWGNDGGKFEDVPSDFGLVPKHSYFLGFILRQNQGLHSFYFDGEAVTWSAVSTEQQQTVCCTGLPSSYLQLSHTCPLEGVLRPFCRRGFQPRSCSRLFLWAEFPEEATDRRTEETCWYLSTRCCLWTRRDWALGCSPQSTPPGRSSCWSQTLWPWWTESRPKLDEDKQQLNKSNEPKHLA